MFTHLFSPTHQTPNSYLNHLYTKGKFILALYVLGFTIGAYWVFRETMAEYSKFFISLATVGYTTSVFVLLNYVSKLQTPRYRPINSITWFIFDVVFITNAQALIRGIWYNTIPVKSYILSPVVLTICIVLLSVFTLIRQRVQLKR